MLSIEELMGLWRSTCNGETFAWTGESGKSSASEDRGLAKSCVCRQ